MTSRRIKLLIAVMAMLLLAPLAQAEDKPSVWLVSFYPFGPADTLQMGVLDALEAYGFISAQDRSPMRVAQQIQSADNSPAYFKRIDAGFDLNAVRDIVASALDKDPDALITISTPVTLAALLATQDMADPPAIFFADVYNPYEAGLADASCIKPDHVTGVVSFVDYDEVLRLMLLQDPDLKTLGAIHNTADAGGVYGASQIAKASAAQKLTVEQAGVTSLSELSLATEGLVSKGVEAILLPMDYMALSGLPLISQIANEHGIPVFTANLDGIVMGATVGAGFAGYFDQGNNLGLLVVKYLLGELDLSRTAISSITGPSGVAVNTLVADATDVALSQELLAEADFNLTAFEDGIYNIFPTSQAGIAEVMRMMAGAEPLESREERDMELLASLACTDEIIAEQRAELDAPES